MRGGNDDQAEKSLQSIDSDVLPDHVEASRQLSWSSLLIRRYRGPGALRGFGRAAAAGLAGALAGTAAGLGVAMALPETGFLPNVGVTLLASAAVLVAFLAVVALADGGDLRAVTRKVIRL